MRHFTPIVLFPLWDIVVLPKPAEFTFTVTRPKNPYGLHSQKINPRGYPKRRK